MAELDRQRSERLALALEGMLEPTSEEVSSAARPNVTHQCGRPGGALLYLLPLPAAARSRC
jgi:hypothetical protein